MAVAPKKSIVMVGEPVALHAYYNDGGITGCMAGGREVSGEAIWTVDGKQVSNPVSFDKPGTYTVTGGYNSKTDWAEVIVEEDVAKSEEQADPSTLERIFMSGNDYTVDNGGKPVSFTTTETRRVRLIGTYHWNLGEGTSSTGSITLKSADGKTVGTWKVNRTGEGQGGVPNAYWYVDIDLELPPGTYTIHDSDPSTWAQNAETNGFGHAWVDAEKKR